MVGEKQGASMAFITSLFFNVHVGDEHEPLHVISCMRLLDPCGWGFPRLRCLWCQPLAPQILVAFVPGPPRLSLQRLLLPLHPDPKIRHLIWHFISIKPHI